MAYVVLARKYRPDRFSRVLGQEAVARTLSNALRNGRVAHAYLFTGPRGVGKTSMARILARALLCEEGPTPEPCGKCRRCDAVAAGRDIDVIEIDGASNRGIENVRDLRESVRYAAAGGTFKVYIVDEVHQITPDAFNAFLKTLEEPPAHVVFVFATTEPSRVPETIRSRCQEFEFRRIPEAAIARQVVELCEQEGVELEAGMEREIARRARGGLRDALSLLDQLIAFGDGKVTFEAFRDLTGFVAPDRVRELVDAILGGDLVGSLAWVGEALDRGAAAGDLAEQVLEYLRALLHRQASSPRPPDVPGVAEDVLRRQSEALEPGQLLGTFQVWVQCKRLLRDVEDERLALEMVVLETVRIAELPALGPLLRELRPGDGSLPEPSRGRGAALAAPEPAASGKRAAPTRGATPPDPARSADLPGPAEMLAELREDVAREAPSLLVSLKDLEADHLEDGVLWVRSSTGGPGDLARLDRHLRSFAQKRYRKSISLRLMGEAAASREPQRIRELDEIKRLFGGETVSE